MEDRKDKGFPVYAEDALGMLNVASSGDCTGLEPRPPVSESEAESYAELYNRPTTANVRDTEITETTPKPKKSAVRKKPPLL